jgi:hypothetical protein
MLPILGLSLHAYAFEFGVVDDAAEKLFSEAVDQNLFEFGAVVVLVLGANVTVKLH